MQKLLGLTAALAVLIALPCAGARAQAVTDYVLGADDVIDVSVTNHTDLNRTVIVRPDGKISFPEIGELSVAGKTPRQLAADMKAALEKTRNNVEVIIEVKEVNSRKVRAVGAVRSPNSYALKPKWRLMDLVAVAGGLTAKPVLVSGSLIRDGTKVIPIDVQRAISDPSSESNPPLQPDDLVIFSEMDAARRQVHVLGQVAKPGAVELQDGTTLISLLSQAGNPTETAALSKSYILRGTTRIPVDLRRILVEGKTDEATLGFALQPGDALFIPEIEEHYGVMGQVRTPSYYPLPEREPVTVLSALSAAGGQSPEADLSKAGVVRMVNGKTTVIPVNIEEMFKKRDMTANVTLQANDILYVPTKGKRGFNWTDVIGPFSLLSYMGIRLFR
ncbi:MAG: SLBB domain-containing protein [Chthonomonadales bacterium]|nr:SLBB domain-containing protein [Chthonomonadales bacterium]